MEAILLLLVVGVPLVAGILGIGRRGLWFAFSALALVLAFGSYLISTTAALGELERPVPTARSNAPPGQQKETASKDQPDSRGKAAGSNKLDLPRAKSYSSLAKFFAGACLGFLFAGVFFRTSAKRREPLATPSGVALPPSPSVSARATDELHVTTREVQGITVLDLSGRLVLGEGCDTLREHLRQLFAANRNRILLSLRDVARVDSAGVGILVEAVIDTVKQGGQLKLVHLPRLIQALLTVHRLSPVFEIYDSEDKAVASFKS
jgi:anti-sigma B factor antagonist